MRGKRVSTVGRGMCALAVVIGFALAANAADLKSDTVQAWESYVQAISMRMENQTRNNKSFLWVDDSPEMLMRVQRGEVVVSPVGAKEPQPISSGLIHHWFGAALIPGATLDKVVAVTRDYSRYKDFFQPSIIASRALSLNDTEDHFSMLLANRSLFRKSALDCEFKAVKVSLDSKRVFTISRTTHIRELAQFGDADQHALPEDEGTGLIWRLFAVTRLEERNDGVYVEVEALALSRDVPGSLRWILDPIIRRVAKAALNNSLQQTRAAVRFTQEQQDRAASARKGVGANAWPLGFRR